MIDTMLRKRFTPRSEGGVPRRRRAAAVAGCWLWTALFSALVAGCTRDLASTNNFGNDNGASVEGYATVQLVVPGAATPGTYAAAVSDETEIAEGSLYAIVYAQNNDGYWKFRRVVPAEITGEGTPGEDGYQVYDVRIPFYAGDRDMTFRMGLIAGISLEALQAAGGYDAETQGWALFEESEFDPETGDLAENPLESARSQITFTTAGKWPVPPTAEEFVAFPMWGESEVFNMRPEGAIAGTINLTRAVARIDVGVNFLKNADNKSYPLNNMQAQGLYDGGNGTYFKLESVRVYRTSCDGTYGAAPSAYDQTNKLVSPTITEGGVYDDLNPLLYTGEEITAGTLPENTWSAAVQQAELDSRRCLTRQCYVPETANAGAQFGEAACLVVGGRFGSATADETFYRIDFETVRFEGDNQLKPTPESRIHLLRNNAYVVNIIAISGPGEKTPEQALTNEDTKLTAEIAAWDQSQQVGGIVTDGVYMLSVDKSEVQYYADGTPETFTVKTNYIGELEKEGWELSVSGAAADAVVYYDEQGNAIPATDPRFPKSGTVGTSELRFGMTEFYNETDVQTRSAQLVFSAGRMKTQVILNQTSRELLRLSFNPEELYFGPEGPQKTVTATVTTRKDYKLIVSGSLADGTSYTHQIHPAVGGNPDSEQFLKFFIKKDANDNDNEIVFIVEPTHLTMDRVFSFDITAVRVVDGVEATDSQLRVTEPFVVTQLKTPVEWKVVSVDNMPTNVLNEDNPYEVIVPNTATGVKPRIETEPGELSWWFSKGTSTSASDSWITNLSKFIGVKINPSAYPDGLPFTLEANTGLARRSMTLNVESNEPGLDPSTSRLIITQKGSPLTLEPFVANTTAAANPQISGPKVDPATGRKYYELHHGYDLDGGDYTLGMKANTNWFWYWTEDDAFASNLEMLAPDWELLEPGPLADWEATTDGPNGDKTSTWDQVASFTVPGLDSFNVPDGFNGGPDANEDVPLGGTRTVVRELRNSNPQLSAADVEDNATQLRITRSLPAYTYIAHWPFLEEDETTANSERAEDQYTSLDTYFEQDQAGFKTEPFSVLSNAPVKLTVAAGSTPTSQEVVVGSAQLEPTKGYQELSTEFTQLFEHGVNETSWYDDARFFKLTATVEQQDGLGKPNIVESYSRIYFRGQKVELPLRNLGSKQRLISNGNHTLKLDFSTSYFSKLKVRVLKRLVNTDGEEVGVDAYIKNVKGGDSSCRVIYLTSEEGVTLYSDQNTVVSCQVGVNNECNMMYRVVAQTYSEAAQEWKDIEDLYIYQDAQPIPEFGYVVLYGPHFWNAVLSEPPTTWGSMTMYSLKFAAVAMTTPSSAEKTGTSWIPGSAFGVTGNTQRNLIRGMDTYNTTTLSKYVANGQVSSASGAMANNVFGTVFLPQEFIRLNIYNPRVPFVLRYWAKPSLPEIVVNSSPDNLVGLSRDNAEILLNVVFEYFMVNAYGRVYVGADPNQSATTGVRNSNYWFGEGTTIAFYTSDNLAEDMKHPAANFAFSTNNPSYWVWRWQATAYSVYTDTQRGSTTAKFSFYPSATDPALQSEWVRYTFGFRPKDYQISGYTVMRAPTLETVTGDVFAAQE